VVRVVCQPDRPSGRGLKDHPPPVKERALALGLPVIQPLKMKPPELAQELRDLNADVAVVIAYGRILPRALLDAPARGCVNLHASILPRWRGAGPIQWAIASGDRETGVCLMQMEEGLDTGPVLACERTPIEPDETSAELGHRLSLLAAKLIREKVRDYVDGKLVSVPQNDALATLAPMLKKEDGAIEWSRSAQQVHDRVRAMIPWPGAYLRRGNDRVRVHRTRVVDGTGAPGTILAIGANGVEVACGEGAIALLELQAEGRKRLPATEFVAGQRWAAGDRLENGEGS
jgi:methionyl-tRNA formyltransferase